MGFFKRLRKPKASTTLSIPKSNIGLGEVLKGAITVSCQDEFDATEVRAELRCVEKRRRERWVYDEQRKRKVRRVYWDVATLHSANPKASGAMHMLPGFKKTFPIKVDIPAGGRESFDGLDANVSWFVKGVVAIKGRPDVTSEAIELSVVRLAGAAVIKEKEVSMIPCEYCGTLTPETESSCPNCGAPRKT